MSAMAFDAPGSQGRISAWLIFAAILATPLIALLLGAVLVALALLIPFRRSLRPHPLGAAFYALCVVYTLAILVSPAREILF